MTSMNGEPVIANKTPDIASGATVAMSGNPGRGGSGASTGAGMRTTGGSIIRQSSAPTARCRSLGHRSGEDPRRKAQVEDEATTTIS